MTFITQLTHAITKNNSLLNVALDPVLPQLPSSVAAQTQPLFVFNKAIIDATADLVCSYKLNTPFYEAHGPTGIEQLKQTIDYIRNVDESLPIIIDAKRADIGNTNDGYVSFIFDYLGGDAVTLHPYLGREALEPFLTRRDKGIIILCRTSNPGASEFQDLESNGRPLYQHVAQHVVTEWNTNHNCLLVVGATYPSEMKAIRGIVGDDMWFLVPGVGTQGGSIQETLQNGQNSSGKGIIITVARSIIYASKDKDFDSAARQEAVRLRIEINKYRR